MEQEKFVVKFAETVEENMRHFGFAITICC